MRKLTNEDIEKWNRRLEKSNLLLYLESFTNSLYIKYKNDFDHSSGYERKFNSLDTEIKFEFSYAVSKNCLNRFNLLLSDFLKSGIMISITRDPLKYSLLECNSKFQEKEIKVLNTEYIQRKAVFKEKLVNIIFLVTCIEDTIKTISEYFEYTEDGTEILKTKFKENEIVSLDTDKTGDYFVISVNFRNLDNKLEIFYEISKIETDTKSEVLVFGPSFTCSESRLIPNRDFRIDTLLN